MIMPSDKDYKETKQIMLGKKVMKPEIKPLATHVFLPGLLSLFEGG